MGKKKDRKERKQTGSQKTALKTEKKNEKKTKKMLQERGEVWHDFSIGVRGDYWSGHRKNSQLAIDPATGTIAIRLFIRLI